jgi:hypothetical protein
MIIAKVAADQDVLNDMVGLAATGEPMDFQEYARECLAAAAVSSDSYGDYIRDVKSLEDAAGEAFGKNWTAKTFITNAVDKVIRNAPVADIRLEQGPRAPHFTIVLNITPKEVMKQALETLKE